MAEILSKYLAASCFQVVHFMSAGGLDERQRRSPVEFPVLGYRGAGFAWLPSLDLEGVASACTLWSIVRSTLGG